MFHQKSDSPKIEALQNRLTEVINTFEVDNKLPASLDDRISLSDYKSILDYFKEYKFNKIKKIPKRFDKKKTKLPRTLSLEFDHVTKGYSLFLETKSKQASNEKLKQLEMRGTYKVAKFCFRLDQPDQDYINLTFYHDKNNEAFREMIRNEIYIPRMIFDYCKSNLISENDIPIVVPSHSSVQKKQKYYNGKKFSHRISFHAPRALMDLTNLVTGDNWEERYRVTFAYQILKIYEAVYNAGIIYQDYKPDNVLVYTLSDGSFRLKLTDFGFAVEASSCQNQVVKGTSFYFSPELIAYSHLKPQDVSPYAFSKVWFYSKPDNSLSVPHWGNDAWAVATTIYCIYFQSFPYHLSDMDWLKHLFATNRTKRSRPKKALDEFSRYYHVNYSQLKINASLNENSFNNDNNNNIDSGHEHEENSNDKSPSCSIG